MKVYELITKIESIKKDIKSLESTLKVIRGGDWNVGIEKDERISIKILKDELDKKVQELTELSQKDISFSINCELDLWM